MKTMSLTECLQMLYDAGVESDSIFINEELIEFYEDTFTLFDSPVLLMFQDVKGTTGTWHIFLKERK